MMAYSRRLGGTLGCLGCLLDLFELVGNLDGESALADHLAIEFLNGLVLLLWVLNFNKAKAL